MSGYRPTRPVLYRLWNLAMVSVLILLSLPLIALIALALVVTQGPRNVFYRGLRIGQHGKPFHIIKFKTLRDEVAQLTRDRVLPPGSRMETRLGKPLRETRLDELPQLFNVLFGDMNMLGPRPVRPSIAEQCRKTVPNYDVRFEVKPGLVGYTQALMPHSTDKAIRARVNAVLCRRKVHLMQEVLFIALTALSVLRWTGRVAWRAVAAFFWPSFAGGRLCRGVARINAPGLAEHDLRLVHIDNEVLHVETTRSLPVGIGTHTHNLVLCRRRLFGTEDKAARCTAVVLASEEVRPGRRRSDRLYRYTMRYCPTSMFQKYLIERYVIGSVLVG